MKETLTIEEFRKLPREEKNIRYQELSDHDKFLARVEDWEAPKDSISSDWEVFKNEPPKGWEEFVDQMETVIPKREGEGK